MNDRFKFRIWDNEYKNMFYPKDEYDCIEIDANGDLHGYGGNGLWVGGLNCISMQCTGLKDKNGTLIYEGDIVKISYRDNKGIIKWSRYSLQFYIHFPNNPDYYCLCDFGDSDDFEVIGNIYENSKLLEGSKNEKQKR